MREGCIVDDWVVRYGFRRDRVVVNAGEIVLLVDAKDVTKEAIVIRRGLAPRVCDVLNLTC